MRDYGKVFSTFWTSDTTTTLSDDAKMLALYLLTGPHTNQIGCFRLPDGYVAEDLGWSMERVSKGFKELFEKSFATQDKNTKWIFIHQYLKWNPLENPNQITGAMRLYEQIPDASSVKPSVTIALRKYTPCDLKGYETLPKPFHNQEQEQEQEQEFKEPDGSLSADAGASPDPPPAESPPEQDNDAPTKDEPPNCPHAQIVAMYHEALPELPRAVVWNKEREGFLRARWRETWERLRKRGKPHDLDALLSWWREYFARVRASPFLMGKKEGKNGAFTATLEWLVRPRNYANVIDGKYLDRRPAA